MSIQPVKSTQEAPLLPQITIYLSDVQIAFRYGVSRQTIWRWASCDPKFPAAIKLSAGCTRWKLSDIDAWESAKEGV